MCDFLDTVKSEGRLEGKAEGLLEGKAEGLLEGEAKIIQGLIKNGKMTVKQIADMMKLPEEKIEELSEMVIE